MNKLFAWLAWLAMVLAIICIYRACSMPPPNVVRYRCIITVHDEILCFEPNHGAMFRPEKRFDEFILEVPAKVILEVPAKP